MGLIRPGGKSWVLPLLNFAQPAKKNTVTRQQYQEFLKEHIFDAIKGISIGIAFCEKFDIQDLLLSMRVSDELARQHIESFYIK
jgi:hypothetical protein